MERGAHLQWAKNRAEEYLQQGDYNTAWTSFLSDLNKHDELRNHMANGLGMAQQLGGHLSSVEEMREWIQGYN